MLLKNIVHFLLITKLQWLTKNYGGFYLNYVNTQNSNYKHIN